MSHIIWVPKYRYRVLEEGVEEFKCANLIVQIPPKLGISEYMGRLKGKSAIRIFSALRICDSGGIGGIFLGPRVTVSLDAEMIRKYVKWQERQEQRQKEFIALKNPMRLLL
jgi:putative transposase